MEFCFAGVFCARLLRFSHFPPTEDVADMEGRMALLPRICQAWRRKLRWWDILWQICVGCVEANHGVFWMQQKDNSQERWRLLENHLTFPFGECWAFLWWGFPPPPPSWTASQVQHLIWFMFPNESLCVVQPCASASFSSAPLATFHAWLLAPVVQTRSCVPGWRGGCCSSAMLTWSIPVFNQLSYKILFHVVLWFIFSHIALPLDHQPYRRRYLTCLLQWGSEWYQKLELEYLFSWTLSWHFLRLCWHCLRRALALIFSQERGCSVAFQALGLTQRKMIRCWELYTQNTWPEFITVKLNCTVDVQ